MTVLTRRAALALPLLALAPAAGAQQAPVAVEQAWARATSPSAKVGGAFLTITAAAADAMVSASSPVAGMAELHQTVNEAGVMKMLPVPSLALAPGKAVELKPGGYHIMLMGLKHPLKQGDSFLLTLIFQHAGPVTVQVHVEAAGASAPAHMHTM
jgi:copper(I)-binding protein